MVRARLLTLTLVLARVACTAGTRDDALAIARPYFEAFAAQARTAGWG